MQVSVASGAQSAIGRWVERWNGEDRRLGMVGWVVVGLGWVGYCGALAQWTVGL